MTQFLYNLLFPFVLLAMLPGFALRMIRRGNYGHNFGQRFGIYSHRTREEIEGREWTWMHAVSVGEVNIALKLAVEMKRLEPELNLVISTTTSTGYQLAIQRSPDWVTVIYNPVDFMPFVKSAMNLIRPARIIMVEAEVWPNLTHSAEKRGIPMALVNARLSPRSARRFEKFKWFTSPVFRRLNRVCVCEPSDVALWKNLGPRPEAVHLTGSIKFDYAGQSLPSPDPFRSLLASIGVTESTPVLIAGSTHPGEEMLLAQILRELRKQWPDTLLIAAPRHVERTPQLVAELETAGFRVLRRTALHTDVPAGSPEVLVLDTTGELAAWYALGTVIFIGKSLLATGGQNPVEAVVTGRPVVFGPHMENFPAITQNLLAHGAAVQVTDASALQETLCDLIGNAERRAAMSKGAQAALAAHQGATERTAVLLKTLIE